MEFIEELAKKMASSPGEMKPIYTQPRQETPPLWEDIEGQEKGGPIRRVRFL